MVKVLRAFLRRPQVRGFLPDSSIDGLDLLNACDVARLRCCLLILLKCTTVHKVCLSRRIIAGSDHTGSAVAKASRTLFAQTSDARCSSGGWYRDRVAEPGLKPSFDFDFAVLKRVMCIGLQNLQHHLTTERDDSSPLDLAQQNKDCLQPCLR